MDSRKANSLSLPSKNCFMRRLVFVVTDIRLEIRKRYNYIMKCENEIPWEMCGILGVTYRTLYPFLFMMYT